MECRGLWGAWPLVLLFLCSTASAHYLREPKNETISSQGTCFYNGTWFQEKEELPTRGLCLICHCFPGFVEPNAFTCSVIDCPWEDYHRRFPGCTPIYADRDCCPIGWECDYGTQNPGQQLSKGSNCDCEWRYLKHYEAKGCRPVYEEKPQTTDKPSCTCPWRFDCSQADEIQPNDKVCVYKKHVYPVGSKIPTTNPCETCTCATDYFTQAASISCTTTECPAVYSQTPLPEGCHYVYKEDQCCPTSVECPTAQKDNMYQVPACEYKGKMFYEGEQIYPDEDPCLICLCNQNWTGINSSSCRQHDCMLERDARKLKQGCIPIYHEKTCCPIDYHCADDDFDFKPNRGASFKSDDDEDEMCFFESRYYPIGHVLDIKHPTNCVTCTCKTPPDFTCIHSSCPPPPNNDYTNCKAVYKPHSCCPDYTCEEKTSTLCPDPICAGTNCWLVKQADGCQICRCKSRCMPCPPMCQPENPNNECSGCICQINSTALFDSENTKKEEELNEEKEKDTLQQLIQECKNMQCASDERCMLVQQNCDKEPCLPVPKCEKVSFGCGQSTCPEGCVEIGSYENNCPLCFCKEQIKESPYKLTCRVQSCEENCILTGRDEGGCPICKCPQGNLEERACASSPCRGFNCTMAVNSLGCAECRCQLSCKPKECPAGCDLDLDVPENSGLECGCQCKNSTTAVEYIHSKPIPESCSDISCNGLNCTVGEDKSGCPYCNCKAPCPTPVCQEGCQVEKTTEPGRCPGCVCKLSRSIRDNKAKECPPPTCLGYNCSVITEENGCQKCLCESPCEEEPQCPAHCKLETNVPEGRCRGCVCSFGEQADANNKPQRGGGKVPDGEENEGEPEKREDLEADFIPLPGKDLVPGVDKLFLIHGDNDQDQFDGIPGYHYNGGHAYPVFGEPLESGLYNVDDHIPGEFESSLPDEAREEVDDATSENRNEDVDYGHDEGFDPEYAEEKAMNDEDDEKCKKKNCPEGQKCVIRRLQCIRTPCPTIPVCIDVEPRCPIPMCAIGCMVMKWDDEVCPSCFCGIIRGAEGRVCPRTRCMGRRCYNVIGDDGCPQCKCDSICIPPKCYDGCFIEKDPPPGKCPTCTCPDRESVVQPIIPGTSPADNATGPIVDRGSENENLEESSTEGTEESDINSETLEPTDDIHGRNPIVLADDPGTSSQDKPESGERNKLLDEDIAEDFYNSLAEIEEQVKAAELTTVTVNLPTTINEADILNITSASEESGSEFYENHFTTEDKIEESTTLSSTPESITEPPPTNFALNYAADESEPTLAKPCILKPNISDHEEEEAKVPNELTASTEEPVKFSISDEEEDTVSPTEINPPFVPSTRKPQRRPVLSRPISNVSNKNTANRLRPQNVNNKVKPRPHVTSTVQNRPHSNAQIEHKRPSNSHSSSSISSYGSKPASKPQTFDPYLDETDPEDMKPILENLQQLMSNLHHVLASHQNQRPTNLEEAFHNLQSSLNAPTKVQEKPKPIDVKSSPQVSSEPETLNESEIGNKEKNNNTQDINKLESIEDSPENLVKDPVPHKESAEKYSEQNKKLTEEDNVKITTEEEQPSPNPQNDVIHQNEGVQQQYFVNPSILSPQQQSIQNQQVVPTILHQGMQSQFHVYPQFQYQTSQSSIPGMGMQPQYPYQNHLQSIYSGGQNSMFGAQPQGTYYPSMQHPSFITNVNPFQSEPFGQTQPNKQHVLLTNIPIPPSLQQQLNAGTQTLGFLQHLFGPNNPFYQQQLLQLQQQQQGFFSSDIKPVKVEEINEESNLSGVGSSSTAEESSKLEVQTSQEQNIYSNIHPFSSNSSKDEKADNQKPSSINEQTVSSFSEILQQDAPSLDNDKQTEEQHLISSEQQSIPIQQQHELNSSSLQTSAVFSLPAVVSSNHRPSVQYLDQGKDETSTELPPMPAFPLLLDSSDSKEKNGSSSSEKFGSQQIYSSTPRPGEAIQFNHHAPQQQQTNIPDSSTPTPSESSLQDGTSNQQQQTLSFSALSPHQQMQHLENIAQQYQDLQETFKQQQQLQHLENIALQYQQLQEQYNQIQAALQQFALIQKNSSKPHGGFDGEKHQTQLTDHSTSQVSNANTVQFSSQQQTQQIFEQTVSTVSPDKTTEISGNDRPTTQYNVGQENVPSSINSNAYLQSIEGKDAQQVLVQQNYISNHNVPVSSQSQQIHHNVLPALGQPTSQQGTIVVEQTDPKNTVLPYHQQQTHDQTQYNLQGVPLNQQQTVNQQITFGQIPQVTTEQIMQQQNQQPQSNSFETSVRPQQNEQQQQTNYIPNQPQTTYHDSINVAIPNILSSHQTSTSQISDPSSFVILTQHTYKPQNGFGHEIINQPQLINSQETSSVQTDTDFSRPLIHTSVHINQQQAQNQYEVIEQGSNKQPENSDIPIVHESSIQQQNSYFQYSPVSQQQNLQEQHAVHSTQHFINSHYKPIIQQNNITQNSPFNQQQSYLANQPISSTQQFMTPEDKTEIQLNIQNETNSTNNSINAYEHTVNSQHVQKPQVNVNAGWNYAQQQTSQQTFINSQDNRLNQNQPEFSAGEIKPFHFSQHQNNLTSADIPLVDPNQSQQQYLQQHQSIQQQPVVHQQYLVPQQTVQPQQFGSNLTPLGGLHQQQYLQPHQQYFVSNERPLTDLYQNQQQHYILGERPLPDAQGQQQYVPQQQTYQQHQFISNGNPLPGSYPVHQQYQTHVHQQAGQQQQYIQQQHNIQQLNQPPLNFQQQQNVQQQYLTANEKPIPSSNIQQQFFNSPEQSPPSGQQQHAVINEQSLISSSQNQQPQQFASNVYPTTISQHLQYQQQYIQQPTQQLIPNQVHDQQNVQSQHFNANDKPLLPSQVQHQQQHVQQQYFNANEKPLTPIQQGQQQISSVQHASTYVQPVQQQQNLQHHAANQNMMQQNNQQYLVSHETPVSATTIDQDKNNQKPNITIHSNRPLIQSQQASTAQEQGHVNIEQFSDPNEPLHQQYLISDNNDTPQQEFLDQGDLETQFSDENVDQTEYSSSESENSQVQDDIQTADSPIYQHNVEDKYSALKPIAQIITAETQSNLQSQQQNQDNLSILGPNEAVPIQQVLENLKNNDTSELHSQSIPQESVPPVQQVHISTHGLKTRPGAVVRPHFPLISSTTTTTTAAPNEHDLFPAPSRPINNKPAIQQQDWFDQEFVEDDSPQELEGFEYDEFEEPESTTIVVTEQSLDPYRQPVTPSTKPPADHFSRPTPAQQPLQHEILENFDNHQPDSVRKPIDQQLIGDEFKSTSQKYFFQRTSTTPRPFTSNKFASFPTVSPTAEAYSVSKYPNKTPLSPIPSYQCPTPHCNGYNCSLIRGSDGCQKCVCDSPCAPCPQHCVKTKTLSEGRCPICDCTAAPPAALSSPSRHCPPVDCSGNNCRTVRDNDGCMTCICDPKCVEPQCDPGCEILRDVPPGQCPGCVCRVTVVQAVVPRPRPCSPVTCGKNCKETRGPDGCPQCVCHPECPPLKCDPGCSVQNDVAAGQCPTCVCSNNYADDDDDEDDDLYCPNLFCSEYGCREVPGPAGCPICMCDPVCKTPVCDPGCQVVSDKYHGRCPVCLCSNPINGTSASEPIKTEEGIKTAPVQQVVQQEQQVPVTFSGIIEAVVAEEEVTESTLHTTVTVELDTEPYTEETTTEATTTTTESPTCPAPVCSGLRCNMEVGDDGCEVCKCKYKCPKPKCVGNCYAETNAPSHRCPGCVCPSRSKPPKY
ncbi:unnamed protein product [Larinioides sclopetarius]|uniref:VWFC domain-containing protein n=1 Tax=Larinioides sclopetarius TaxID=280406 RepID=A0AAV2AGH2_9ARAC